MNIFLFDFAKRLNSTKQPSVSEGINVTGQLKDETSFLNPVIKFSKDIVSGAFSPAVYNYASIPYWQRYYYITDWKYLNGVWEASMVVDPMASFKSDIGNTSAYVIRSSYQFNGNIVDTFYPATTQASIIRQQMSSDIYQTSMSEGCFVLGCINNENTANRIGSVTYYALTNAQLASVMSYLFSDNIFNASDIDEIGEGLYKSLFDPFQYIVSCMWYPFPVSTIGSASATIKVGYWSTGVSGKFASTLAKEIGFKSNLAMTQHPQSGTRGEYLNHAPYTKATVYYPPFGEIPLDLTYAQYGTNNYVYGKMFCDFITGIADCYFTITNGYGSSADPYKYSTMRTAQIGVPIQISQIMSDYLGSLTAGLGAVTSGFTGNIAGIFGNIASAVESAMPKVSNNGANGSFIEVMQPPVLIMEFMRLVDEDKNEFGRPLCSVKQLSSIPGFIQCGDANHAFNCTRTESEEINRNLKEGFFYE